VDGQSIEAFETDLKGNLYKIWNRMSSGSYFPPPVRLVEIPKANGGSRPLGIPTVGDRVAQMVVKMHLEPLVEPYFHPDSTGIDPEDRRWTRLPRRESGAGGPTGSSIWISKDSLIIWIMNWS
jgi:retron-type reverse transcriptase